MSAQQQNHHQHTSRHKMPAATTFASSAGYSSWPSETNRIINGMQAVVEWNNCTTDIEPAAA